MFHKSTLYIQAALDLEASTGRFSSYSSNFLFHVLLVAGCALIKTLNSTFVTYVDSDYGKTLFNSTIVAMRKISLREDDISDRLAEKLMQIWRAEGSGVLSERTLLPNTEDPLQLRVRCRMSVSHVFDCVWGWKCKGQYKERRMSHVPGIHSWASY